MATLERAIQIAVEAHTGATDKGGNPYILHPLRVMFALSTDEERIVGILHDVVEDCSDQGWTFSRMEEEGFSDKVLSGLRAVTKLEGETDYQAFVHRAANDPIGRRVKIADITDNLDVTRIPEITDKDLMRISRYKKALSYLESQSNA
jgi:(p)ppGpp synthase/HD superfamily hydrolase